MNGVAQNVLNIKLQTKNVIKYESCKYCKALQIVPFKIIGKSLKVKSTPLVDMKHD